MLLFTVTHPEALQLASHLLRNPALDASRVHTQPPPSLRPKQTDVKLLFGCVVLCDVESGR